MAHPREIQAFFLGRTEADKDGIKAWLDYIGFPDYDINQLDTISGAAALVGCAAKRCYLSFEPGVNPNITKVRSDWHKYFENILSSGHGSVCEHATYNFALEGITRVCTGELNRHRAGVAISEGSMRYIRFDDIPFWMPDSFQENPDDPPELAEKKRRSREWMEKSFQQDQENYVEFVDDIWGDEFKTGKFGLKKKLTSAARRGIGMGVSTGGVWTFNIRALRHVIALRTTEHAEEEIAHLIGKVAKIVVEKEPNLFGDFKVDEETGAWVPEYDKV